MKKRSRAGRKGISLPKKARGRARIGAARKPALRHDSLLGVESTEQSGEEMLQMLERHQQGDLSQAKAQWLFGEWAELAATEVEELRHSPERDRFALLAASAHQQLGDHDRARKYTKKALQWGCPPRLVAQILVAGVHNTLGRAAALARDDSRAARHFRDAVAVVSGPREAELLSHARSVREMAKLGLLPQAATLVDRELAKARELSARPDQTRERIRVIETELELLNHELSLAQQRQQLYRPHHPSDSGLDSDKDEHWRNRLSRQSVSQLGQDLWVLEQTGYKRGGFFVEFGATDGVLLSNTWLLEREFGWRGICAEPNPTFFEQLKKNRSCTVSNACIGGETGKSVNFVLADAYGGISDYAHLDMHAEKRAAYKNIGESIQLETISLHDFLKRYDAPHEIDYVSIDTEGSEFEIVSAFPFSAWKIGLLTIEHNFTPQREEIRRLLARHGYRWIEREWEDWYMLT